MLVYSTYAHTRTRAHAHARTRTCNRAYSEGRFHQIRESLIKVGLTVVKLHRERVGRLALSEKGLDSGEGGVVLDLRPGQWCVFKKDWLLGRESW